jgi:hypothetical protein
VAPALLLQLLETFNLYPARHLSDSCGSFMGFLRLVAPVQLLRQLLETFNLYPARHLSDSCGS